MGRIVWTLCLLVVALALAFDVYPTYADFRDKRVPLVQEMREVARDRVEITAKWRSLTPAVEQQVEDVRRGTFWPAMHHVGREAAVFKAARLLLDATFGRNFLQRMMAPEGAWEFGAAMVGLAIMVYALVTFATNVVVTGRRAAVKLARLHAEEVRMTTKAARNAAPAPAPAPATAGPTADYVDVPLDTLVQHPRCAVAAY
jgi:hypothetical protein